MWASWLLNPSMLGLGALAVGVPILIHLLNKRRFKIVEWAAMDFLFQADKKNRRRVRLENFILLMLRCLAMLLIGMLLARPFLPSQLTSIMNNVQKYERVLLLDDSLSQKVLVENQTALDVAKDNIKQLLTELADSDQSEDWMTLYLTSRPKEPFRVNEPVTKSNVNSLIEAIDGIECTDAPADYRTSFQKIRDYVSGQRKDVSRIVYVYSDLRERDWSSASEEAADFAANKVLQEVSDKIPQGFVVDVASELDENLAITDLRTLDLQVGTKIVTFDVEVSNFGRQTANDVRILFQVDDAAPKYETIASITPGAKQVVQFRHLFSTGDPDPLSMTDDEAGISKVNNFRVKAEIDRQSLGEKELQGDQLIDDSVRMFASRVLDGIPVLLVDGDASLSAERSETFYLNLLKIFGTGLKIETVNPTELENVSLANYRVIFLCNVDSASDDRIKSIEQWVRDGGNIVIMPGNQVDSGTFNQYFHRDGEGLSPISLQQISGDSTRNNWVNFEVDPQIHPAVKTIVESDSSSLGRVEIFSWWSSVLDESKVGKTVVVPLRLSDAGNSAAMVEQSFGKGKAIVFTIPADGDWTMWPGHFSFPPIILDLIDYLVGNDASDSVATLGGEIRTPVDLSLYQNQVSLRDPKNEKIEKVAKPAEGTEEDDGQSIYYATFEDIDRSGFYELGLNRHSGETDTLLFASNVDTSEGKLKRLDVNSLNADFFGENFSLIKPEVLREQEVKGSSSEIWPQIVILLLGILGLEQFLAWLWGRRR